MSYWGPRTESRNVFSLEREGHHVAVFEHEHGYTVRLYVGSHWEDASAGTLTEAKALARTRLRRYVESRRSR